MTNISTNASLKAVLAALIWLTCAVSTTTAQDAASGENIPFSERRDQIQKLVNEAQELKAAGQTEAAMQTMNRARSLRKKLFQRLGPERTPALKNQPMSSKTDHFPNGQDDRSGPPPLIQSIHQAVEEIRAWTREAGHRDRPSDFGGQVHHLEQRMEELAERLARFQHLEQELEHAHHRMQALNEAVEHAHRRLEAQEERFHDIDLLQEKIHELQQNAHQIHAVDEHMEAVQEHVAEMGDHLRGLNQRVKQLEKRTESDRL